MRKVKGDPYKLIKVIENFDMAVSIIRSEMGRYHGYYAKASKRLGARGLVLLVSGMPTGSTVFYKLPNPVSLGIIYYVVVNKRFRGRGLGKLLVLSAEEILRENDSEIMYLATISRGNHPSIHLFHSLGYKVLELDKVKNSSPLLYDVIKKAACAYEDDFAAIKTEGIRLTEALNVIEELRPVAEIAWRKGCYTPWLELIKYDIRI